MDKPKSFIHTDKRAGYEVVVIGRVAIPVMFIGWSWGVAMFVTFVMAIFGWANGDSSLTAPFYWVGGVSLGLFILTVVGVLIAIVVEIFIDVNRKENI